MYWFLLLYKRLMSRIPISNINFIKIYCIGCCFVFFTKLENSRRPIMNIVQLLPTLNTTVHYTFFGKILAPYNEQCTTLLLRGLLSRIQCSGLDHSSSILFPTSILIMYLFFFCVVYILYNVHV
jgi:hypothetical protein